MAQKQLDSIVRHLHRLALPPDEDLTDRQLLQRFVAQHDERAFAALVRRHAALVLGACRRVLRQTQDAEDVFQATFIVLARKAASTCWQSSIGNWLYTVASRLAREAQVRCARRRERERQVADLPDVPARAEGSWQELYAILDEELQRLPERYRGPLLLCYLEGQTRDRAARQLGWSLRTLHRRLERGLELLRARLTSRGLALSLALLAAGMSQQTASRACSAILLGITIRTALHLTVETSQGAAVSPVVASLAEAGVKSLTAANVKFVTVLLLALGGLVGAAALAHQALDTTQPRAKRETPKSADKDADPPRTDREGVPLPPGAIARLGTTRLRPMASELAFRDDRTFVTCGSNRVLRFWDVATGTLKKTRQLPGPHANRVALSRDGKRLALEEEEGISVWDVDSGARLHLLRRAKDHVFSQAVFSPDGRILATAEYPGGHEVRSWNLDTGAGRLLGKATFYVDQMLFSPDGKRLILHVERRTLLCWDIATGKELWRRPQRPRGLGFSPDGRTLAVGDPSDPLQVRLIDAATGQSQDKRQFSGISGAFRVQFSPDGKTLAIGLERSIALWDLATGKERCRLAGAGFTFAFAPDGKSLISLGAVLQRWDVTTGKPMYEDTSKLGHTDVVATIAWSPDGRRLASIGGSNFSPVHLWSVHDGRLLHTLPIETKGLSPGWRFAAFTPDGKCLLTASDQTIRVWDAATLREARQRSTRDPARKEKPGWLMSSHLSHDGKILTAITRDLEGPLTDTLTTWNAATGERRSTRKISIRQPLDTIFSPDGRSMILHDGGVYDVESDQLRFKLSVDEGSAGLSVRSPAISPDGVLIAGLIEQTVVTGNFVRREIKGIQLWRAATGKPILRLPMHELCRFVFSPDGRFLATVSDGAIRLWEIASAKEVFGRAVSGHLLRPLTDPLGFAPDGRSLAIGVPDTTILIWDVMPAARASAWPLSAAQVDRLWSDLAGTDAAQAYTAIGRLIARPAEALSLLGKRLQPVAALPTERAKRLLADLDSDQFERRDTAARQLTELGKLAEPALREALVKNPALDLRRRIEQILSSLDRPIIRSPQALRDIRAVCVLEQIGTPPAKEVLENVAKGAPSARLTREAKAALKRLAQYSAVKP